MLAAALVLFAAGPAGAQTVLSEAPYYLSLHGAEGERQGTVMLLHGGGWQGGLGPAADQLQSPTIRELRGWGFDVGTVGYRGGEFSLEDSLAAFDRLRKRQGPGEPICAFGFSAGAHLALAIAARRGDDVACVVDLLGPPDLQDFGERRLSERGERLARQAFGPRRSVLSPLRLAADIAAPVLIGSAACDAYIDPSGHRELARRLEGEGTDAALIEIAAGDDVDLEHCTVSARSYERFLEGARRFLAESSAEWSPPAAATHEVEPGDDDSGSLSAPVLIGLAVALAGAALAVWAWRR